MSLYQPVMDALLALLQAGCGTNFKTYTRRLVTWEALAQQQQTGSALIQQPYLCLFDGVITADSGVIKYERTARSVPAKREMMKSIVVYAQMPGSGTAAGPDSTTPGGDVFYPLLETIESALEVTYDPTGTQTLGGLVFHCWIEGTAYMFTGDIDPSGQGMMIVPVRIMIP